MSHRWRCLKLTLVFFSSILSWSLLKKILSLFWRASRAASSFANVTNPKPAPGRPVLPKFILTCFTCPNLLKNWVNIGQTIDRVPWQSWLDRKRLCLRTVSPCLEPSGENVTWKRHEYLARTLLLVDLQRKSVVYHHWILSEDDLLSHSFLKICLRIISETDPGISRSETKLARDFQYLYGPGPILDLCPHRLKWTRSRWVGDLILTISVVSIFLVSVLSWILSWNLTETSFLCLTDRCLCLNWWLWCCLFWNWLLCWYRS